jgi:hypothetical protein
MSSSSGLFRAIIFISVIESSSTCPPRWKFVPEMEVIGSVDGWYESYYNALGIWMTQTGNQRQAVLICVDVVRIKSSYDGLEHRGGMGVNCDSSCRILRQAQMWIYIETHRLTSYGESYRSLPSCHHDIRIYVNVISDSGPALRPYLYQRMISKLYVVAHHGNDVSISVLGRTIRKTWNSYHWSLWRREVPMVFRGWPTWRELTWIHSQTPMYLHLVLITYQVRHRYHGRWRT